MRNNLRLGLIGSWVPKKCGIATFGRDLAQGMQANDPSIEVFVAAPRSPTMFINMMMRLSLNSKPTIHTNIPMPANCLTS